MIVFMLFLFFVVQPLIQYHSVFGTSETYRRYIVEEGVKPPLFGSYSYDPLKQIFEIIPSSKNRSEFISEIINSSNILSTIEETISTSTFRTTIHPTETDTSTEALFRKRVVDISKPVQQRVQIKGDRGNMLPVYDNVTKHRVF